MATLSHRRETAVDQHDGTVGLAQRGHHPEAAAFVGGGPYQGLAVMQEYPVEADVQVFVFFCRDGRRARGRHSPLSSFTVESETRGASIGLEKADGADAIAC